MSSNNLRSKTEVSVDQQLQKMLNMAAGQKLLPKIIYDTSITTIKDKAQLLKHYRKSVKNIYTKQTKLPLQYNPQQARSHRQKFREKVLKLINNELPIEYFDNETVKGKRVITFKGFPLEQRKYDTRKQFSVFADFSENKFKKGYNEFFDDKLEFVQKNILSHQISYKHKTSPNQQTESKEIFHESEKKLNTEKVKKSRKTPLPKLITSERIKSNKKTVPVSPLIEKKPPTKIITQDQDLSILQKMKIIGSYPSNITLAQISLTKESITKYFRQWYGRPYRIIDFLQINPVENFLTFKAIPQKLKFMPKDHINFMIFLFYDTNNDGIICERDLLRIFQLIKKCPLIGQDYYKIKKYGYKQLTNRVIPYKQLYKLPQITQGAYFHWKNKKQSTEVESENPQLREYLKKLNKQKLNIDFEGFQRIYKGDKPFLWYDIMWRIGGIAYQGIQYQ